MAQNPPRSVELGLLHQLPFLRKNWANRLGVDGAGVGPTSPRR